MTRNKVNGSPGLGRDIPPRMGHVIIYFSQQGYGEDEAKLFYQHHQQRGWKGAKGAAARSWKTLAGDWIWKKRQRS